jgi:Protein of unknown function (DUF3606)
MRLNDHPTTMNSAPTANTSLHSVQHHPAESNFADANPSAMVDLAHDNDLNFWTGHLHCSAEKLLAAVESVGPRVEHVTEYLRAGW